MDTNHSRNRVPVSAAQRDDILSVQKPLETRDDVPDHRPYSFKKFVIHHPAPVACRCSNLLHASHRKLFNEIPQLGFLFIT